MPDLVFHPDRPDNGIITGLAAIEPDPRAPNNDLVLDAALRRDRAATAPAVPS